MADCNPNPKQQGSSQVQVVGYLVGVCLGQPQCNPQMVVGCLGEHNYKRIQLEVCLGHQPEGCSERPLKQPGGCLEGAPQVEASLEQHQVHLPQHPYSEHQQEGCLGVLPVEGCLAVEHQCKQQQPRQLCQPPEDIQYQ